MLRFSDDGLNNLRTILGFNIKKNKIKLQELARLAVEFISANKKRRVLVHQNKKEIRKKKRKKEKWETGISRRNFESYNNIKLSMLLVFKICLYKTYSMQICTY